MCIYALRHQHPQLRELFNRRAEQVAISTIVLSELHYGVENSAQPARNLSVLESFAARLEILPFGQAAAAHSGQVWAALKARGQPIGPYDVMIAGHARSAGLALVTNNSREFERVPGLLVERWV
jgi:tRNA(fMet)-specific endonuclease VapC